MGGCEGWRDGWMEACMGMSASWHEVKMAKWIVSKYAGCFLKIPAL